MLWTTFYYRDAKCIDLSREKEPDKYNVVATPSALISLGRKILIFGMQSSLVSGCLIGGNTSVTLEGDIFQPSGLMTGGSRKYGAIYLVQFVTIVTGSGDLLRQLHALAEAESKLSEHQRRLSEIEAKANSGYWTCFPAGKLAKPNMMDLEYIDELKQLIEKEEIPAPALVEQQWTASSRILQRLGAPRYDVAGVVVRVGSQVRKLKVGELEPFLFRCLSC
ncbi:SMCs flexible hinge superfamily [Sesbania bispinosa]|nr:SMCs flexible hinge superfamily [Sesbania bispinosa]